VFTFPSVDKNSYMILEQLSEKEIQKKIDTLDIVYHITENRNVRQKMLLALDELKLELMKRKIND